MQKSSQTVKNQRSTLQHSPILILSVLLCIPTNAAEGGAIPTSENNICLTSDCVDTANVILNNMDRSVNPCDDFYKFACGGFLNSTIIPSDQAEISVVTSYEEKVADQLKMSFEAIRDVNETRHLRLVKNLYDSCMNTSKIEAEGLTPLQNILKKLGGWPVLEGDAWIDDDFDWIKMSSKFQKIGYSHSWLVDFFIEVDMRNTSRRIIYLDQPEVGREYMRNGLNDLVVQAYYSYMVDIAVYLGANRSYATQELGESLQFHIDLADITVDSAGLHNVEELYNAITLKVLANRYSSIAWEEWFAALLPSTTVLTENEPVMLIVPSYITKLEKLLAATPKRTVANYMFWRLVDSSVLYLNEKMRKRSFFWSSVLGQTKRQARWKECVTKVTTSLPISTGALYVKSYFNEEAKRNAVEVTVNVMNEFKKLVKEIHWMDNQTKNSALEKADNMNAQVAYRDELLNDTKVNEYYQGIELTGGNYLESHLNVTLFGTIKEHRSLRLSTDRNEWSMYENVVDIEAYYEVLENTIVFPAGILQGILFSSDRPSYMNYGAIGTIIGHEITHGFDAIGHQFDKNGNAVDWWEPATKVKFIERTRCLLKQYNNYTHKLDDQNMNDGILQLAENIADNLGIKPAYFAYIAQIAADKPEQKLLGLPYTPKQMFWISMANMYCSKIRPEAQKNYFISDPHSPSEFRVNGRLSNFAQFSNDFNCPVGSGMNPVNKCVVW